MVKGFGLILWDKVHDWGLRVYGLEFEIVG
jgi:hypothetical protein